MVIYLKLKDQHKGEIVIKSKTKVTNCTTTFEYHEITDRISLPFVQCEDFCA